LTRSSFANREAAAAKNKPEKEIPVVRKLPSKNTRKRARKEITETSEGYDDDSSDIEEPEKGRKAQEIPHHGISSLLHRLVFSFT